jgi:cytochrome c-type biogenesis protein CcmH/NrfF
MRLLMAAVDTAAVLSWAIPLVTLILVAVWLVVSVRRDEDGR